MDRIKSQEFAARVAQASRSELIVIIYDVIIEDIAQAETIAGVFHGEKLTGKQAGEFKRELNHAVHFLNELMTSLDFHYPLSYELWSLYVYVNRQLIQAAFSGNAASLPEVSAILGKLQEAFIAVAKQDSSGPVMQHTQHLTAGLTYGRGRLNEICIDTDTEKRGYFV